MKRPNLVYILNDHQAHYGHSKENHVKRPYFEQLAKEGVEFDYTYTVCPLCGPARRTMLTGLYPHNHREIHNDTDHPYDTEVYLDLLAENGYRNYYFGKWHAGAGTALDHHCEGFNYPSYNNPYTKPEYKDYLKRYHLPEPEIEIERNFIREGGKLMAGEMHHQNRDWCNEHATGIMKTPKETHEAFFLAALACEKLEEIKHSEDETPFTLRVDFWGPHQPYFPTQEFVDLYQPDDIPEYPSFRNDLQDKPEVYLSEDNAGISRDGKLIRPNPLPWSEWQKVLQKCYAQITLADEACGRILDKLKELGFDNNTLVIYTTDHGDAVASQGGHFDKRSYLSEEMLRIPLAMKFPGWIESGQVVHTPVSNIDIAPTLMDAAGLHFQQNVDGKSLLQLLGEPGKDAPAYVVSETYGHMEEHFARAISDGHFKYVYNRGQREELYDLSKDPYELKNLAGLSAYAGQLLRMKQALMGWKQEHHDHDLESLL